MSRLRSLRKLASWARDPTLRRWAWTHPNRILSTIRPSNARRLPPYLDHLDNDETPYVTRSTIAFTACDAAPKRATTVLPLPGHDIEVKLGEEDSIINLSTGDVEVEAAVHRFAWIPLLWPNLDPGWVTLIWQSWRARFAEAYDSQWAWEAYTVAERVCNLLDFSRRFGLPGPAEDTLDVLTAQGAAIIDRLEYSGESNTSNHLANNGRGLFRLGLELGLPRFADIGGTILVEESKRLFRPSGILREGSSHYHLVVLRHYADAWLSARAHGRPEETTLADVVRHCLAVVPHLYLPGGLPLIGDVSPDSPPAFLAGLHDHSTAASGWLGMLEDAQRDALRTLAGKAVSLAEFTADGWIRLDRGPWASLWHVSPDGWPETPGHAHQDCGSFELHFGTRRVLVDAGRIRYGEEGDGQYGQSALAHNALTIDGLDPFPANKPYYDSVFRAQIAGPPPRVSLANDSLEIQHFGYSRLGGVGAVQRNFRLTNSEVQISDRVEGQGRRRIARRLVTPLAAESAGNTAKLYDGDIAFRLIADRPVRSFPVDIWPAYGRRIRATCLEIAETVPLPWSGEIQLKAL